MIFNDFRYSRHRHLSAEETPVTANATARLPNFSCSGAGSISQKAETRDGMQAAPTMWG